MVISLPGIHHFYNDVMYVALNSHLFMWACMAWWMNALFTHQYVCVRLKDQVLHLEMDFSTLKSICGLAALPVGQDSRPLNTFFNTAPATKVSDV